MCHRSENLPGDDIARRYQVVLVIGEIGDDGARREDAFVSMAEADALVGVRDFLRAAARSVSVYKWASGPGNIVDRARERYPEAFPSEERKRVKVKKGPRFVGGAK